jgi:hypothetical protein
VGTELLVVPSVCPLPRLPVLLMLHLLFSFGSFDLELRTKGFSSSSSARLAVVVF